MGDYREYFKNKKVTLMGLGLLGRSLGIAKFLAEMKVDLSMAEITKTKTIPDRREAIKLAVNLAQKGDVILIAGKGHETYQEIKGHKYHFNDMEELRKILT